MGGSALRRITATEFSFRTPVAVELSGSGGGRSGRPVAVKAIRKPSPPMNQTMVGPAELTRLTRMAKIPCDFCHGELFS